MDTIGFLYQGLNGFEGWVDKKMIFNGLEANRFHNHFALIITYTFQGWLFIH
jgi:hypothetical protein